MCSFIDEGNVGCLELDWVEKAAGCPASNQANTGLRQEETLARGSFCVISVAMVDGLINRHSPRG